jgi:serine/threonine protein kinase
MAPEVLCKQVHSYPVDFYAIGVISYELMLGKVIFFLFRDLFMETIEIRLETQLLQNSIQ